MEPSHRPIVIELFAGLHGWGEGFLAEGWRVIGFDIVDMCALFGVTRPCGVELVLQDVLTLDGRQFRGADLIVASPPCFVADTLILTNRGLIPIPEVVPGDLVLTHRKRWRRVLKTGSTIAKTLIAKGYGGQLEGTAEHPILTRKNEGGFSVWDKSIKAPVNISKHLGSPEWTRLAESKGHHWASPTMFEPLAIPSLPNSLPDMNDFWWIVGRWVGDGWVRLREKTGSGDEVIICCAHSEANELEERLNAFAPRTERRAKVTELHWRRSKERTVTRFTAASNAFAKWLVTHFGRGASMKEWPAWALGMKESNRRAMLDGYVSADGSQNNIGIRTTTVSKKLAIGTKLLAASLGTTSNIHFTARAGVCRIEGRLVKQKHTWTTSWNPQSSRNRHVESIDGFLWGAVRNVSESQEAAAVWNLEVEEDNSYIADGIVVHNCQEFSYMAMPWSLAKEKAAKIRASQTEWVRLTALFWACFRIAREAGLPLIVENVKGAQPWVGAARWHFGSFYLWGDVPALMPHTFARKSVAQSPGKVWSERPVESSWSGTHGVDGQKNEGGSWFAQAHNTESGVGRNPVNGVKVPSESGRRTDIGKGARFTTRDCGDEAIKLGGSWFHGYRHGQGPRNHGSKSSARKAASAQIAKIPYVLASHIARVFHPEGSRI